MDIFVMRHGTTIWNENGKTQGRTNNRLSNNGKQLVENMAKKYCNTSFDAIICSPLMRTMQTANIMNKYHKVKVLKNENLIEINQGVFTGRTWKSLTEQEKILKKQRSKTCFMESYDEAFERAENFIAEIKTKYPYKSVLVVTHNIIASFIEDIIEKKVKNYDDASYVKSFGNAEIKHFEI